MEEAVMAERTGSSLHGCAGISDCGDLGGQKVSSPFFKNCPVEQQSSPRYRSKWLHGIQLSFIFYLKFAVRERESSDSSIPVVPT
jgi:hypothetical protein